MDTVDNLGQEKRKSAILGIYAKQPIPGQCKTRLSPPLTLVEAAGLYECSLRETVERMQCGTGFDLAICYSGECSWFEQAFPGVRLAPQQGADLGARMATSLHDFLQQGYRRAVLIGSDAPDLPLELVEQAFSALQQSEVVIAPANDGGYVLIGEAEHHPQLFEKIAWSTANVLSETQLRLQQQQISASILQSWHDLDDLQSLEKFLHRSPQAKTADYLHRQLVRLFPQT